MKGKELASAQVARTDGVKSLSSGGLELYICVCTLYMNSKRQGEKREAREGVKGNVTVEYISGDYRK